MAILQHIPNKIHYYDTGPVALLILHLQSKNSSENCWCPCSKTGTDLRSEDISMELYERLTVESKSKKLLINSVIWITVTSCQAKNLEKFQTYKDKSLVRKEILSSLLKMEASHSCTHTFVHGEAYEQFTGTSSYHLLRSGTHFSTANHLESNKNTTNI